MGAYLSSAARRGTPSGQRPRLKHLDGELTIYPRPSVAGERRAEIRGQGAGIPL